MTQLVARGIGIPILMAVSVFPWAALASAEAPAKPAAARAAPAQGPPERGLAPGIRERLDASLKKGFAFLLSTQREDGGWPLKDKSDPAVTALVVKGLVQERDYGPRHPAAKRGIDFMLKHRQPDGGIYTPGSGQRNYYTSVCLMALAATADPAYQMDIEAAQAFLANLQWDEGENYERSNPWYGGAGYGEGKRPDLSNTQMMIEALKESGLPTDDPTYHKALLFVQRCQMLSQSNDQPFARGADDGGFVYTCANGGESKAGTVEIDGRPMLRSYGSMTYAGFKSLLYADIDRSDPRIQKAWEWIRRHYTLESNPNMPEAQSKQGLFYFYHVFAKTLYAWGQDTIVDGQGREHRWRDELCEQLLKLQRDDGSWINTADRWYESNPYLVTAYAILAAQTASRH